MDPETGRFLTRGPIGIWGDLANLGNGYTYAGNNPWSLLDPFGLEAGGNQKGLLGNLLDGIRGAWDLGRGLRQDGQRRLGFPKWMIEADDSILQSSAGLLSMGLVGQTPVEQAEELEPWYPGIKGLTGAFQYTGEGASMLAGGLGFLRALPSLVRGGYAALRGIPGAMSALGRGLRKGGEKFQDQVREGLKRLGDLFRRGADDADEADDLFDGLDDIDDLVGAADDTGPRAGGNASSGNGGAGAGIPTGQLHHPISKPIARALDKHETLGGLYRARDPRFTTRAIDEAAHRGYQHWHIDLDKEVVRWIQNPRNARATSEQFEAWLRWRYNQPDLLGIFPEGF